jgi:hypothetical protein
MQTVNTTSTAVLAKALSLALNDMTWLTDEAWQELAAYVDQVQRDAHNLAVSLNEVPEPLPWELTAGFFTRALGTHVMDLRSRLLLVEIELSKVGEPSDDSRCLNAYIQLLSLILNNKEDYAGRIVAELKSKGHAPETPV